MKNTKAYNTHKKFSLRQKLGKVSKTLNLRGLRLHTQSLSPLVPEYEWFRNQVINGAARSKVATSIVARALIAACALLLILFSCIGEVEGIAKAQANALHVLSVPPSAAKPTRTPPDRRTPTPVPTTPTLSPTLAVTLTTMPTTMPTALTNATPSVKEAMAHAAGKRGDNSIPTSIPTQPTPSSTSTVWNASSSQQKGNSSLLFVIIATLIGIGSVILLLVIGLLLLRKYLIPSAKTRLVPSGAPPWHRVTIKSLDDHTSGSSYSLQTLQTLDVSSPSSSDRMPTAGGFLPTMKNVIPSRRGFSSITSNFAFKRKQLTLVPAHFLRPTKLKKMHNNGIIAEPKNSASNFPEQNQSGAAPHEPWEELHLGDAPSLDDPYLREMLEHYILKGQLARQQSNTHDQPGHDRG